MLLPIINESTPYMESEVSSAIDNQAEFKKVTSRMNSWAKRNSEWDLTKNNYNHYGLSAHNYDRQRIFDGKKIQYYQLEIRVGHPSYLDDPYVHINATSVERESPLSYRDRPRFYATSRACILAEKELKRRIGRLEFRYDEVDSKFLNNLFKTVDNIRSECYKEVKSAWKKVTSVLKYGESIMPGRTKRVTGFKAGSEGFTQYFDELSNGLSILVNAETYSSKIAIAEYDSSDFYNDELIKSIESALKGTLLTNSVAIHRTLTNSDMDKISAILQERYDRYS